MPSSIPPIQPLKSSIDYTLLTPELLDKIAKTFPDSDAGGQFARDLLLALHNHTALTFFQKTFIFVAAFFPGPFSWKLAVFAFLYQFSITPVIFILLGLIALWLIYFFARQFIRLRLARREPLVFLEATVPTSTSKSAYATEQFFTLLHALAAQRSFVHRFLGHKKRYSLELVATREHGIKYVIAVPKVDAHILEKGLLSYVPGLSIRPAKDYVLEKKKADEQKARIVELKLASDFVLPLTTQKTLAEHDPIAYLAGNMTKLQKGEQMAFQVVVSPVNRSHRKVIKHLERIKRKIAKAEPLASELFKTPLQQAIDVPMFILIVVTRILTATAELFANLWWHLFDSHIKSTSSYAKAPRPELNTYELDLQAQVKEKIDQSLFEASARLLIIGNDSETVRERLHGFMASVGLFATPYQSLDFKKISPDITPLWSRFIERRLSTFTNLILTPSELTDLYHFPYAGTTKTEGLVTAKSRDLPAPLSQKRNEDVLDVVVGTNIYGGEKIPVGLTAEQRHQHTYIVGKTGMGKSTIIAGMALQDMAKGKGLVVIDPHGDLVKRLLTLIPESRRKDVIYINPADKDFPVGLNILNPGIHFADKEEEDEWITGSVMSVFMKITPKERWGQRMEHILRNAVLTALASDEPDVSLFTVQRLLTDKNYRTKVATRLKDPILKQFWLKEFALFGSMQQAEAISPLTNKLGEFFTSPLSRRILLQSESTVNIAEAMDKGKIVLVNLSKGELGEERSAFFGTVIVSLIQLATYARARMPEEKRKDFFVYIDEFQNFATPHFTSLFSESRKFHVFFIPTHQSIAQIDDSKITSVISGNAGTLISLKTGPDDEAFVLPFMKPEVEKGEIVNLPPYRFLMKVTSGVSEDSFSGETIPISEPGSSKLAEKIIDQSRKNYATPRELIEEQMGQLLTATSSSGASQTTPAKPATLKKTVAKKQRIKR